jgi:hypothetical protein
MAGKVGRPPEGKTWVAVQVRLKVPEADAFRKLVARREAEVARAGGTTSESGVLRSLVLAALEAEDIPVSSQTEQPAPATKAKRPKS